MTTLPSGHASRFAFITMFLDAMGIGLILPVLPELIEEVAHVDLSMAAIYGGYLGFIYAFMQFLCGPTLGNLSDRFGRRPVLLLSLAALAIDYLIMGVAPSLWLLGVGRFIAGIAGATHSTAFAYVADVSKPEDRTRNFGLVNAAFGFGFIAGPLIGGLIGEFGTRAPFFFAAGLVALNGLYGLVVLPESLPLDKRRAFSWVRSNPAGALLQASHIPGLLWFFAAFLLFNIAGWIYPSIWSYYTREAFSWSSREIGLSLGIYGLFHALTLMFLVPLLLRHFREKTIVLIGTLFQAATLIGIVFITKGWLLFLFLPISALEGVAIPAMQSLMANRVPDDAQGELQGAISSLMAITTILSPLIMTQAFAFFTHEETPLYHPAGAFGLAACITLLSLIPLLRAVSTPNQA